MRLSVRRGSTSMALIMSAFLLLTTVSAFSSDVQSRARQNLLNKATNWDPTSSLSPMGRLAQLVREARQNQPSNGNGSSFHVTANGSVIAGIPSAIPDSPGDKPDVCFGGDEDCSETGLADGPGSTQSEMAIAIDRTGKHIVVGFNDFRGFNLPVTSTSGFAYSDDGGATFTDGGQLPTAGSTSSGLVFGDPDVKYIPGGSGCQFVYSSIYVMDVSVPGNPKPVSAQTMSIHRSTDCGHTWAGPFEVKSATLPTSTTDAADKEFISVDPDTGRLGLSWSNFVRNGAGGVEIRFTYSDNVMNATPPAWSSGVVLNQASVLTAFDTGSAPRFAGLGSDNAYVAWSHQETFYTGETQVAVSHDNGSTFDAPATLDQSTLLVPTLFIDDILGNDRAHQFPSIAVDNSTGRGHGSVYVAYATNGDFDGSDVVIHRSTDGGATWSEPTVLSSRPGTDRAQWFPTVSVDAQTGRVNVVYDDQGVSAAGDVMEMEWVHSDDGGNSWSRPSPVTRPFHGGYGNDTGQPNLGDYNASVSQDGILYTVFTITPQHASFVDGEPTSLSFPYPSFLGNTVAGGTAPAPGFVKIDEAAASLHLSTPTFVESGGDGFINPGDFVALALPITNYVTNPATSAGKYEGIQAFLSTSTPGITVVNGRATYPNVAVGETQSGRDPFVIAVSPSFIAGTPIELSLEVKTSKGHATLVYSQPTGTPIATTLLNENFNGVPPGSLPAGWTTSHGGGTNTVPWTTNNTFCGTSSNAAFHQDALDNGTRNPTRFERLFSPALTVPVNSQYVTLDMDLCYDTEDDPLQTVLAYDGLTVRITDLTSGHMLRSVFPEAYAEEITTGGVPFFPKHLPRSSNSSYFQDISAWAGSSGGRHFDDTFGGFLHNPAVPVHVHMKLPGMAGVTSQLRFEYTQDSAGTCLDVGGGPVCGVQVDNVVVQSVTTK